MAVIKVSTVIRRNTDGAVRSHAESIAAKLDDTKFATASPFTIERVNVPERPGDRYPEY